MKLGAGLEGREGAGVDGGSAPLAFFIEPLGQRTFSNGPTHWLNAVFSHHAFMEKERLTFKPEGPPRSLFIIKLNYAHLLQRSPRIGCFPKGIRVNMLFRNKMYD